MNQTHTLCKRPAQQPHTALMGTQCTMSVPAHLDIDPLDTLHTPAVLCQNLLSVMEGNAMVEVEELTQHLNRTYNGVV